jgi:hypothetical protein
VEAMDESVQIERRLTVMGDASFLATCLVIALVIVGSILRR